MDVIQMTFPIILTGLPFPPSVNDSLACVSGRMIKGRKHREFAKDMHNYAMGIGSQRIVLKETLAEVIRKNKPLRVDVILGWPISEVLVSEKNKTSKDWAQKRDGHNRVKQLHDALSEILDIDDRYFFSGDCVKVIAEEKKCTVIIRESKVEFYNAALERMMS